MIEYYFLIKHLHMTTAVLSITFFIVRAWWSVREISLLQRRWVRILPHVNDTLLLLLGIMLMTMLSMWPHQHPWLAAKLLGLLGYILLGTVAIKRGRTPMSRGLAALAAIVVFVYIMGTAMTKDPWFFLPLETAFFDAAGFYTEACRDIHDKTRKNHMANQDLPSGAGKVADDYPEVWRAYAALGKACAEAGPLDDRTRRLVKLALAVGGGSEGAVHSHMRRAMDEGIEPEALKQVAMLAIPTLGLPAGVAALTWIEDITDTRR